MRIPLCGGWEGKKKVDVVTGRVCFDEYVPANRFFIFRFFGFRIFEHILKLVMNWLLVCQFRRFGA